MVLRTLLTGIAEVDSVRTLREARARIAETSYDVVVLDQYVPDGSGLDLIETLKSQTNPPEMMVYSIDLPTADACRAISDSILKTDADNTELLQRIKLLLRTARSQRQS